MDIEIDDLEYRYHSVEKNKLVSVVDISLNPNGFQDGTNPENVNDYEYDANGNMVEDLNKGITNIKYNHLNLPIEITFGSIGTIDYLYDAAGVKLRKRVSIGGNQKITDYLSGFHYINGMLEFFPHSEGYVKVLDGGSYNYVYQYKDHLGNVRVSFGKEKGEGDLMIMEENHYYPFGLKHNNYNMTMRDYRKNQNNQIEMPLVVYNEYKYKYNGKEWQDELGLNMYDFHARNYDPAIGRWMNIDPLDETTMQPYSAFNNNPIRYNDPTGMIWEDPQEAESLRENIRNKISSINNDVSKWNEKLNKEGISDKKAERLRNKISNAEGRVTSLNESIEDINTLRDDLENTYRLVHHKNESSHVIRGSDNVINIQGSSQGMHIHEIRHVALSLGSSEGLQFTGNYLRPTTPNGLIDEMEGYKAQYAFEGNRLPFQVNHISEFNHSLGENRINMMRKIGGITSENGNPVYRALQKAAQNYNKQLSRNRKIQRRNARN